MRTLLLVSTALVLAACSDTPQPTAPRSIGSASTGAGDRAQRPQALAHSAAKPSGQVGFTQITTAYSAAKFIGPGLSDIVVATCPAGTTLMSGGYQLAASTPVVMTLFRDNGSNGWEVGVTSPASTPGTIQVFAIAYCIS